MPAKRNQIGFVGQGKGNYMATLKQIEANRRNALKSTGPRTPEGKAAASLNALKHGLRARRAVLPGENQEEFHQLCDDLEAEWQPETRSEQFYVEQMAVSQWKLTRMEVAEHDLYEKNAEVPMLDRLWKAQHSMERAVARAQRELERLQKFRQPTAPSEDEGEQVGQALPPANSAPEVQHATSEIHQIPHPRPILAYNAPKGESIYGQGHGSQERSEEAEKEKAVS